MKALEASRGFPPKDPFERDFRPREKVQSLTLRPSLTINRLSLTQLLDASTELAPFKTPSVDVSFSWHLIFVDGKDILQRTFFLSTVGSTFGE